MINVFLTTYQGSILGPIARLLGYILQALYAALSVVGIENTGICIILFTLLINALMAPMQFKQQKFAKLSAIMNPEIKAIQDKYKNKKDPESQKKMSMETQILYQKYGVSPAGGCLPMLITFPIIFALYRVIYNIPAYVPQVYNIYDKLAISLQNAGVTVDALAGKEYIKNATYVVTQAVKSAEADPKNINYYIDVLSQFNSAGWDKLASNYSNCADIIHATSSKAFHINSFLGLNIADTPNLKSISIIIPILSVITQIFSVRLSMAGNPQTTDPDNPTASTMKMMNTTMPLVSGFMCLMFPIGVGIYWIAGNVFRIFQSLCFNFYFSKVDMDELIKQNMEKAKKKNEKRGINTAELEKIAKTRTTKISSEDTSNANAKNNAKNNEKNIKNIAKNTSDKASPKKNGKYKEGSIAAYANMLKKDDK